MRRPLTMMVITTVMAMSSCGGSSSGDVDEPDEPSPAAEQAEIDTCQTEAATLRTAIRAWRAEYGDRPESIDDLTGPDGNLDDAPEYWTIDGDDLVPTDAANEIGCTEP